MSEDYKDIERSIIGITFALYDEAEEFRSLVNPDCFDEREARICFEGYIKSSNNKEYLDYIYENGLAMYVNSCMDASYVGLRPLWRPLARKLMARMRNRRFTAEVTKLLKDQQNDTLAADIAEVAEKAREEAAQDVDRDAPQRMAEQAISLMLDDDREERIYTGIGTVDSLICGLRKGNVSVLGAEPSCGKTAFALNIARHTVRKKKKVLYFSLEMSATQLLDRMVSDEAEIDYSSIGNKCLTVAEKSWYKKCVKSLTNDNLLYIFDTVYYVEDMLSYITSLKPDLVIVDFLQFCRTTANIINTADRLEYIVSEFKRIAKLKYCSCHIILLSQPSRQGTKEGKSMFALKGSSAIEQGGDVIMLLDRPAVRDANYPTEQASLQIAKNKFGKVGETELFFEGGYQRFREKKLTDIFTHPDNPSDKPW